MNKPKSVKDLSHAQLVKKVEEQEKRISDLEKKDKEQLEFNTLILNRLNIIDQTSIF